MSPVHLPSARYLGDVCSVLTQHQLYSSQNSYFETPLQTGLQMLDSLKGEDVQAQGVSLISLEN